MNDFADYHAQNFASLCIFFLILAMLLPEFTGEHAGGTQALLLTASPGMKRVLHTKLLAALTAVLFACVWMHLTEFLTVLTGYHLDGWDQPVYAAKELQFITLSCTNTEMIELRFLLRLLTGWTWALTVLLISAVCRNMFSAASVSVAVFGILLAGTEHFQMLWNPFYSVQLLRISRTFDCVRIFGNTFSPLTAAVMIQTVMQMVLLILTVIAGRKRRCAS